MGNIEEITRGESTITGVATSITAFLGRAISGLVNEPITINNYGDFERQFGGLGVDYPMSYAVRDFYLNGGSQAIIIRLYKDPDTATDKTAKLTVDGLEMSAKNPGEWGKKLRASIDVEVSDEVKMRLGLTAADALFNLTIRLGNITEKFLNVTVIDNARRLDRVLKAESSLIDFTWTSAAPTAAKTIAAASAYKAFLATPTDAAKKTAYEAAKVDLDDEATKAEKELAAALAANPQEPSDIGAAKVAINNAEKDMKGSNGKSLDQNAYEGNEDDKTGLHALDKADLFNLLCIPPDIRSGDTESVVYQIAMSYCQKRRAMLIVDAPATWSANKNTAANKAKVGLAALGLSGDASRNAALYFPRVLQSYPLRDGEIDKFVPCGIIAGVMARTDTSRGVWKAPAGLDASVNGIQGLDVNLNDAENGMLNPLGINCLRTFPDNGCVVWGARTLRGADQLADEWKYISVRRTALYIEESLYRGTQWAVFELNNESLWGQIRFNLGAFMNNLFRQGAFQGSTPREAYFVKCDKETTTQNDINLGIVNVVVGFAPLKPAEFVVIKLQQRAGQIAV
jgi:phage tail sheath protein FI